MATTLYLVSAETPQCEGYWKVGITAKADPLKRNPKAYREVFRVQVFEDEEVAKDVELAVARVFKALAPTPHGRETLAYGAGLEVAAAVFDFCFEERLKWEWAERPLTGNEQLDYYAHFVTVGRFCRDAYPRKNGTTWMPWGADTRIGKAEAFAVANQAELDWGKYTPIRDHVECFAGAERALSAACVLPAEEDAWARYFDMVETFQKVIGAEVVAKPVAEPMWA
jgi:hypothetical protein